VVTATLGERGLAAVSESLDVVRGHELQDACRALGVSRLVTLGYGDSGMDPRLPPPPGSLCAAPVAEVADRLLGVLREEGADVLTIYDPRGGYGHRDHVRIHDAGVLAAGSVPGLRTLEATVPREALTRAVRVLNACRIRPGGMTARQLAYAYRSSAEITHEIDVRPFLGRKVAALRAHASQASGGTDPRTVHLLSRPLVARTVLGREWFVEVGGERPATRRGRFRDLFVSAG
jgi:LmbE family N-acetylglucosaminyl deacetylase